MTLEEEVSEEEFLDLEDHITQSLGFITYDHYLRYKSNAIEGLITFGGSFAKTLGELLRFADHNNSIKIISVWRNEISQHEMLWRIYIAKREAKVVEECEKEIGHPT